MRIVMSKSGCKSAKGIASIIGCPSRYGLPKNPNVFIVSYGKDLPQAHLNRVLIKNKKQALILLEQAGLPVPKIIEKNQLGELTEKDFPIMGRKLLHSKGTDIKIFNTKDEVSLSCDYYLQYINKWSEYRVHVLGGEAKVVAAKTHADRDVAKKGFVWNETNGWKQYTYTGEHLEKLKELGVKAVKVLGYDFGAVDIIRRKNNFYILEVNSAPGLIPERQQLYAEFFKQKEIEWKKSRTITIKRI